MKKIIILALFLSLFGWQYVYSMEDYAASEATVQKNSIQKIDDHLKVKFLEKYDIDKQFPKSLKSELFLNDQLIGVCKTIFFWNTQNAKIKTIKINPDFRNRGFASMLLDVVLKHLEDIAIQNPDETKINLKRITLTACELEDGIKIEPLLRFYAKRGFKEIMRVTPQICHMQKTLER